MLGAVKRAALVSAALVLCSATVAFADAPLDGKLAGGGAYLVRPTAGAPVAGISLWYRAPSSGFDRPVPGLGRLAAAAVAASQPITGTALGKFVDKIGGRMTIAAYPESIAISIVVPADRAGDTVRAITRSYFAPVLTDGGLAVARRDVVEDGAIRGLSPEAAITDALYASLFAAGPAKIPPFGSTMAYTHVSIDDVRSYAERAFRPGNAVLVLTGNVGPDVLTQALAGREGATPGSEAPAPETLASPLTPIQSAGAEAGFGLGWAGPPIADERSATAFDFIADYLFYPETGTVQKAVRSTGASLTGTFVTYHDPGVFLVTSSGGDQAATRAAVDAALARIRKPLDAATFAAAQRQFIYHILSDDETPGALADTYGWYSVEGNPEYAPGEGGRDGHYLAAASALTPAFVAATAAKYLDRPGAAITVEPLLRGNP